jgi:hypothetical protein
MYLTSVPSIGDAPGADNGELQYPGRCFRDALTSSNSSICPSIGVRGTGCCVAGASRGGLHGASLLPDSDLLSPLCGDSS